MLNRRNLLASAAAAATVAAGPDATLAHVVDEVRSSIDWLAAHAGEWGGDVQRIVVSGWSAGGHLTAMCMDAPGVVGGLAISGNADLEPVRLSYVNDRILCGAHCCGPARTAARAAWGQSLHHPE